MDFSYTNIPAMRALHLNVQVQISQNIGKSNFFVVDGSISFLRWVFQGQTTATTDDVKLMSRGR